MGELTRQLLSVDSEMCEFKFKLIDFVFVCVIVRKFEEDNNNQLKFLSVFKISSLFWTFFLNFKMLTFCQNSSDFFSNRF